MATMAAETATAKAASMTTVAATKATAAVAASTVATTSVAAAVTAATIATVPIVTERRTIVGAAVPAVAIPTAIAIRDIARTQRTQGKDGSEEKNQFCFHIVNESDADAAGLFSKSLRRLQITWETLAGGALAAGEGASRVNIATKSSG